MKRIFLCAFIATALAAFPAAAQYKVTDRVKLGGEGFWDYLTVDPAAHRLYITRGNHVMVVETQTLKVVGDIPDLAAIHGVALAKDLNRGFISNGGDNTVTIFDLASLKPLDRVKVGDRPDAIFYDSFNKRVYTFNAKTNDSTVLDGATGKVVGTIALGGRPETPVSDGKGAIFVTLEDKSEIVKIDVAKLAVTDRWSTKPCDDPSAMAFDAGHHRLFAGCQKMMAVVNSENGKVVTTVPIAPGVDAGDFDPHTNEIFMSCGAGSLAVIHENSPDSYSVKQTVETQKGARTMALDPLTNTVFLVTAEREATPPAPGQRPAMIPGSFTLIVVKKE